MHESMFIFKLPVWIICTSQLASWLDGWTDSHLSFYIYRCAPCMNIVILYLREEVQTILKKFDRDLCELEREKEKLCICISRKLFLCGDELQEQLGVEDL